MKILTVVGARPQFIKAAAVSRVLQGGAAQEILLHTGQHYDANMSQIFFEELGIPQPKYHLEVGSGSHGAQTGKMLEGIESILLAEKPDWVMVYGDTNSTLAGALAASKLHIRVAHVEAGLRSFNRRMPEEINRVLTDHASDLLFAPTATAVKNLANEGLEGAKVSLVGDVMYDTALFFAQRAQSESKILSRLGLEPKEYVLTTVHRAENTDEPKLLRAIVCGLIELGRANKVVWPVHPRAKAAVQKLGLWEELIQRVMVCDPAGYLDMTQLERHASLVVTDSGGIQKEAYFHQVPCITLRAETEWVELVDLGWNHLIDPAQPFDLLGESKTVLGKPRIDREQPYGDGSAAKKILEKLMEEV